MAPNTSPTRRDFTDAQLKIIRRSVARLCTPAEFDEFMAVAALCGLDPLRRQITPLIVAADDPVRRRLIPWTTIDGLRIIAARNGDYRPMSEAPFIEYDETCIDQAANPLGVVRAEVRAWKAHDGAWHAVAGEAWWDEYAPVHSGGSAPKTPPPDNEPARSDAGAPGAAALNGGAQLDPAWRRMGRVMIAKCAEAQALRRGWPDLLSGLYGEEELHALRLGEHTASELLRTARDREEEARKASRKLWFSCGPDAALRPVPVSDIECFVSAVYQSAQTSAEIERFDRDNRQCLTSYWEWMPTEALRLKVLRQARSAELARSEANLADERIRSTTTGDGAGRAAVAGVAVGTGVAAIAGAEFAGPEIGSCERGRAQ